MKTFTPSLADLNRISILDVFTLVLWLGCLLVGVLGFVLPYTKPLPLKPLSPPVTVEMLNVELSSESLPALEPPPKSSAIPSAAPSGPNIPQPIPVAEPSPAIAFASPMERPTRIVDVSHAASARISAAKTDTVLPAPQTLTFGQGEGRQPAPEYPMRARREGQQGSVTVRFTVAAGGRVTTAEIVSPSPWSLLNDSALHTVQERWRFPAGTTRVYDVVIRFELMK